MESANYSCQIKIKNFLDILSKNLQIKFRENPSSGSRVVPCGRTDMTKLSFFATSRTRLRYSADFSVHIPHKRNQQEKKHTHNVSSFCKFRKITDQRILIAKSINCNSMPTPLTCH